MRLSARKLQKEQNKNADAQKLRLLLRLQKLLEETHLPVLEVAAE